MSSDFESPVIPGESLSLTACRRILARVRNCGNFAWYMNHTESLACCVRAVAEADGTCPDQLAEKIREAAVQRIKKDTPDVVRLQGELDIAESAESDDSEKATDEAQDFTLLRMEELLQYCRVTNQRPTIEAIEHAVHGGSLAHCLMQM